MAGTRSCKNALRIIFRYNWIISILEEIYIYARNVPDIKLCTNKKPACFIVWPNLFVSSAGEVVDSGEQEIEAVSKLSNTHPLCWKSGWSRKCCRCQFREEEKGSLQRELTTDFTFVLVFVVPVFPCFWTFFRYRLCFFAYVVDIPVCAAE